jgi:hypothetical protein
MVGGLTDFLGTIPLQLIAVSYELRAMSTLRTKIDQLLTASASAGLFIIDYWLFTKFIFILEIPSS